MLNLNFYLFRVGSWLAWQVQTHCQLLQLSTSLFLACALDSLHQAACKGYGWDKGMERVGVVRHSTTLLLHLMKMLNIFQHVIENRDLEDKETKVQVLLFIISSSSLYYFYQNVLLKKMETLSPKGKLSASEHSSVPPKEMIGNTFGSPHYHKFYESLSAAYTNYQV